MRFLVVDDEPDALRLVEANLAHTEHECMSAASADEARELCADQQPDVLLLDVALPGTDGPALLRDLRQSGHAPDTVVLVSALAPDDLAATADDLGVEWLAKPFTSEEFRARLTDLEQRLPRQ